MLWKKYTAICLTALLASTPLMNEAAKANESLTIDKDNLLLGSTQIDNALQSVEVEKLLIEDFAITILEQPNLVGLEIMEDLPKQQQVIREHAELFLAKHKPEFISLNERTILVSEYMLLYNDYFTSEIQKVQEGQRDEKEVKQEIEAGLQELTAIIEEEKDEVNDVYKKIGHFLVNLDEDYKQFDASVKEAEEYVIAQEGEIASSLEEMNAFFTKRNTMIVSSAAIAVGAVLAVAAAGFFGRTMKLVKSTAAMKRTFLQELPAHMDKAVLETLVFVLGGTLVTLGGIGLDYALSLEVTEKSEDLEGLNAELATVNITQHGVNALVETTNSAAASLEDLTNAWDALQSNIQMMMNDIADRNINELKYKFEESYLSWEKTQNTSDFSRRMWENTMDLVEIDLDEMDTEEELKEELKEVYDVDELIDIPDDLTVEELEELLRELFNEEMDGAAHNV